MSNSVSTSPWPRNFPWVAGVFALCAVSLAVAPHYRAPAVDDTDVPESATDPTPVRERSLRPACLVANEPWPCSHCHRTQPEPYVAGDKLFKHSKIRLAHGINTRCLNCHHPVNREAFVDDYGEEIPWDQPQLLCGKCHGPVYRDWQHGSHGRINGHWDTSRGELVRLKCVQCHDPHHPPFQPLATAPAPRTLHGTPHQTEVHSGARNPLRLYENSHENEHAAPVREGSL